MKTNANKLKPNVVSQIDKAEKLVQLLDAKIEVQQYTELENLEFKLETFSGDEPNSDEFFELLERVEFLRLQDNFKVELTKTFHLNGSNVLLQTVYNNSVEGIQTNLSILWSISQTLTNATGKSSPMTWNAFTRTWNTSTLKLAKNKLENFKNASVEGYEPQIEKVSFFHNMELNLNDAKLYDSFKQFANDKGKIEVKVFVISELLDSSNNNGLVNRNTKLVNTFKIANASLPLVKAYLLRKGAKIENLK